MAVDYTPTLKPYEKVGAFRYWCQTTLPLVYDDSKSYLELLYSVIHYLNSTISDVANMGDNIDALLEAYNLLQGYVNDYFDNLDVQSEINAKLDEMATDGTLDNLLEPFVQTFVSDWLADHLTPTTPPIDDTLTISGAGADAKTVGDRLARCWSTVSAIVNVSNYETSLPSANDVVQNSVYRLNFAENSTAFPSGMPFTKWEGNRVALLITTVTTAGMHSPGDSQTLITGRNIWVRNYMASDWGDWLRVNNAYWEIQKDVINVSNYATLLPSADTVNTNSVYRLNFAVNSTAFPAGMPFTAWEGSNVALLITSVQSSGVITAGDSQLLITGKNVWIRNYGIAWSAWTCITSPPEYYKAVSAVVNASNYAMSLPSADDVVQNSVYRLNFAENSTAFPSGMPFTKWEGNRVALLITTVTTAGMHSPGDAQTLITSRNVWVRNYLANAWSGWEVVNNHKTYTVDINGTGDYTSLYACIVEAIQYKGSVINVKKGTYDVIAELKALRGDNYFTNFNYATDAIFLTNGLHIIGEPGVVVTAEFDTPLENVANYFSPFDIRFDCTLENLEVRAKNCRYCIHDDQWDRTTPYTHIFRNLTLICDNTQNSLWDRRLAFGGGLGTCGHIEFWNCYFQSLGLDGTAYSGYGSMGYHNSPVAGESDILVNGCYFADNSTFRLTYMGTYSNMTQGFVSGCSLGRAMEVTNERYGDNVVNVEIIDCNNVIREV